MKKQITVIEENDHEGEIFNYVIYVTDEEEQQIREMCDEFGDELLTVSETNYTEEDIDKINNSSSNSYMDFIALYELNENALDEWEEFGDCFYKGCGLTKI